MTDPRIIVALDCGDRDQALNLAGRLDPGLCRLKVGKELFTSTGPGLVRELMAAGFEVFLDLKFHDIPTTVAQACKAAARLGVWMVNVHALGGRKMLQAARDALGQVAPRPKLVAVTLLTSLERGDLAEIGLRGEPAEHVTRLASLAQDCGLDGVVCSAQEAAGLRRTLGLNFCLVTPGIRTAGVARDDQNRVATPAGAVRAGADYLVIGRQVSRAADPRAALVAIQREMDSAN